MERTVIGAIAIVVLGWAALPLDGAPFTQGNLVVLQVGDEIGGSLATSNASPIVLKEFNPADSDGTFVQAMVMPTVASPPNRICTLTDQMYQGLMTRSANGLYLVLGGYDAPIDTPLPNEALASAIHRVVARVDQRGNIDTTTALTDAFSGLKTKGGIQSLASDDGMGFWMGGRGSSGSNSCVRYAALGATTSSRVNTTSTPRAVGVYKGQLYTTYDSPQGLQVIGSGLPTGVPGTVTMSTLPVTSTVGSAPYGFHFLDDNTLYIAADNPIPPAADGGLYKFVRNTDPQSADYGKFIVQYSMTTGLTPLSQGVFSVTGRSDAQGHAVLYVITREDQQPGGPNRLMTITDTGCPTGTEPGCTAADTFVGLQTAPAGTVFRSVAWAPLTCDGDECRGACCHAGNTCTQETPATCDGSFRGIGTQCGQVACPLICAKPFADADLDNDVDMDDFGAFQACYTGPTAAALPGYCKCFDRPETGAPTGDNDVDQSDFNAFKLCVTGARIPANPECETTSP